MGYLLFRVDVYGVFHCGPHLHSGLRKLLAWDFQQLCGIAASSCYCLLWNHSSSFHIWDQQVSYRQNIKNWKLNIPVYVERAKLEKYETFRFSLRENHVYFVARFNDDIEWMTGRRPNLYWQVTWRVISPLMLLVVFLAYIVVEAGEKPSYSAWNPDYVGHFLGSTDNSIKP